MQTCLDRGRTTVWHAADTLSAPWCWLSMKGASLTSVGTLITDLANLLSKSFFGEIAHASFDLIPVCVVLAVQHENSVHIQCASGIHASVL